MRYSLSGVFMDVIFVRFVKLYYKIKRTRAISTHRSGTNPNFSTKGFRIGTKPIVVYLSIISLIRIVNGIVAAATWGSYPQEICFLPAPHTAVALATVMPQTIGGLAVCFKVFKGYRDMYRIWLEFSLILGVIIFRTALIFVFLIVQRYVAVDAVFRMKVLEIQAFLAVNLFLLISIYLPLHWQRQYDRITTMHKKPFKEFLQSPTNRKQFAKFLQRDFNLKFLVFYDEVQEFRTHFRSLTMLERDTWFFKIRDLFLAPGAPFHVNVSPDDARRLEANYLDLTEFKKPGVTVDIKCLLIAAADVLKLLEFGSYRRFKTAAGVGPWMKNAYAIRN
eukprot:209830_1